MPTRRDFLKTSAMAGAGLFVYGLGGAPSAQAFVQSPGLTKFIQPLAGLGPAGIPVATPDTSAFPGSDYYRLVMGEYTQLLHPELPKPTTLWGYADVTFGQTAVHKHLGPLIVAQNGKPVRLTVTNNLPSAHPLPIDNSLPGAESNQLQNRATLHLHGGHTPWFSDGGPFTWFAPNGDRGPSFLPVPDMPAPAAGSFHYFYPNDQSARLMWYHDHAVGITRLNAYAGLASGYLIRDAFEQNLIDAFAIPGAIPGSELPLIIQDKTFVPNNIGSVDPTWKWGAPGDLWYAHTYDPLLYELAPGFSAPADPSAVPEFFGDTMLVNGLVFPTVTLEPRKYRLRILNACNARFCNLQLLYAKGASFPASAEPALNNPGPGFLQIGTEGGFLPAATGPVPLNELLLAPAERADVIVDFSQVPVGSILILYNDAAAPFPSGSPLNDYYPGARKNPTVTQPGYGPNTRTLLQIVVGPLVGPKDPRPTAPLKLPNIFPLSPAGAPVRNLTLNEDFDGSGRLIQRLGTDARLYPDTFARNYMDAPTENVAPGSTEIWRIFNLTGDTHPIHFHLVNVQVMGRQAFHMSERTDTPRLVGAFRPPDPNETGWKETVRMNPGEMIQVIMKFDLPVLPAAMGDPLSPRTGGHEYVWHCHILEHEEHDMMRPLIVG